MVKTRHNGIINETIQSLKEKLKIEKDIVPFINHHVDSAKKSLKMEAPISPYP